MPSASSSLIDSSFNLFSALVRHPLMPQLNFSQSRERNFPSTANEVGSRPGMSWPMYLLLCGLGLQDVLPPEGLLCQRLQMLMRISLTPCYLRMICNRHPKRSGLLFASSFTFSLSDYFVTVADSHRMLTHPITERCTTLHIHYMQRPVSLHTASLPDPCCPHAAQKGPTCFYFAPFRQRPPSPTNIPLCKSSRAARRKITRFGARLQQKRAQFALLFPIWSMPRTPTECC
ncbi:hypothetical protein GGI43DRAFT_390968 [Trichoderma evansii]